ncbi:MAG: prepilin-type N-terminal cleavage/methylation domain-containing protein [Phycisphaerae bacterium]|jgi:prepilin-type N-terminal cleavage/methylation domain-containing protein
MATQRSQNGLTLVEIIIAVAIVAILAGLVFTTMTSIDTKAKEQLCEGTLETLNTALRQFRDFGYEYRIDTTTAGSTEIDFYRSLKFPPDCNGYKEADVEGKLKNLLDSAGGITVAIDTHGFVYDPNESGIAVMYFFLSQVPDCRATLAGLDADLAKSDHNGDENYLMIRLTPTVGNYREYPWLRVVDPWGTSLRYDYYVNKVIENTGLSWGNREDTIRNFPLLTSAGPDKEFNTDDDITNRDKTKTPVP